MPLGCVTAGREKLSHPGKSVRPCRVLPSLNRPTTCMHAARSTPSGALGEYDVTMCWARISSGSGTNTSTSTVRARSGANSGVKAW